MNRYAKGARLERRARRELETQGYTVIRSAGSRGVVDLVAFNTRHIRLIQIKAHGAARPTDLFQLRQFPAPRTVTRELWVSEPGRAWRCVRVRP